MFVLILCNYFHDLLLISIDYCLPFFKKIYFISYTLKQEAEMLVQKK